MASPLEKARKNPDSMKAKILFSARKLFSEYGYHGTTTRMIAQHVGIDISTLYYHWGEKGELYDAVIIDINYEVRKKLIEIKQKINGRPLAERIEIAIDDITDYLFHYPEISNLTMFRNFSKTRYQSNMDAQIPEFISDIAISLGLAHNKRSIPVGSLMIVMSLMNSIYHFISGEDYFRAILGIDHPRYIEETKKTLKFLNIPPFVQTHMERYKKDVRGHEPDERNPGDLPPPNS